VNPQECGALGGVVIIYGEIRQPICNGAPGTPGQDGQPGEPGHSPTITTRPSESCEFGGIDIYADITLIGTVCNGATGEPGKDGVCPTCPPKPPCDVTCHSGYAKYDNACHKICKNDPKVSCDHEWLSKSQSCSVPKSDFLTCWPKES
jgi:hypothetical protein